MKDPHKIFVSACSFLDAMAVWQTDSREEHFCMQLLKKSLLLYKPLFCFVIQVQFIKLKMLDSFAYIIFQCELNLIYFIEFGLDNSWIAFVMGILGHAGAV